MYKKIYLEITNICNLKCPFCIQNQRPLKTMSEQEFKIVLKKLERHTKYLYFHLMGEPTMHPQINEFIDIASKNFYVNITTNGYLINKLKDNQNIRQVNISLHSFDERYHKSLESYMNDILETIETLEKKTYISLRLWANNKNTEKVLDYLSKNYQTKIEYQDGKKRTTLEGNVFLNFDNEFVWPDEERNIEKQNGMCYALRDHIGILVDGTVVPCCLDSKGSIPLGNIFTSTLEEIINSKRYQEMKNNFNENKRCEKLCQNCTFL